MVSGSRAANAGKSFCESDDIRVWKFNLEFSLAGVGQATLATMIAEP